MLATPTCLLLSNILGNLSSNSFSFMSIPHEIKKKNNLKNRYKVFIIHSHNIFRACLKINVLSEIIKRLLIVVFLFTAPVQCLIPLETAELMWCQATAPS